MVSPLASPEPPELSTPDQTTEKKPELKLGKATTELVGTAMASTCVEALGDRGR